MLSVDQKIERSQLEATIEKGLKSFYDAGKALNYLKEQKLYDQTTFEAYCQERWGWGRQYAYRIINAFKVVEELSPMGDMPLPQAERQARPLTQIPADKRLPAWETALATSESNTPTAQEVSAAAAAVVAPVTEWEPEATIEVLSGPDKGEVVVVVEADPSKPLVTCTTADGVEKTYLTTQLEGHTPPPSQSIRPKKKEPPKQAAFVESLGAKLEIESSRLEMVENSAGELLQAIAPLLRTLEAGDLPDEKSVKSCMSQSKALADLLGLTL